MRIKTRVVGLWLLLLAVTLPAQESGLGTATPIADGVQLYRLNDPALLDPPAPIAVQALRLDPRKVSLEVVRANATGPARETVASIDPRRIASSTEQSHLGRPCPR